MIENNKLSTRQPQDLRELIRSPQVKEKFMEALGSPQVGGYIQNVLIAVAESPALQKCTPVSIIGAALRAATMRLSCDPFSGHAYLVPYKDKAILIVGWKGIYHLAIRTGKYRFLNLSTIYDGQTVEEDQMTGIHHIGGQFKSKKPVGYLLYFQLISGFEKTFYMDVNDCIDHGKKYSKSFYKEDSLWQKDPEKMYQKTVVRMGITRWGYLEPADQAGLASLEDEDDQDHPAFILPAQVIDPGPEQPPEPDPEPELTDEQALKQLGFVD
jgi:recombination protein RecT